MGPMSPVELWLGSIVSAANELGFRTGTTLMAQLVAMTMLTTRRQLLAGAASVTLTAAGDFSAVAHTQAQKSPASPIPDAAITVSIADAIVGKGDLVARVPVTLSVPATHTIVVEYATQDGVGTFGRCLEIRRRALIS